MDWRINGGARERRYGCTVWCGGGLARFTTLTVWGPIILTGILTVV